MIYLLSTMTSFIILISYRSTEYYESEMEPLTKKIKSYWGLIFVGVTERRSGRADCGAIL